MLEQLTITAKQLGHWATTVSLEVLMEAAVGALGQLLGHIGHLATVLLEYLLA